MPATYTMEKRYAKVRGGPYHGGGATFTTGHCLGVDLFAEHAGELFWVDLFANEREAEEDIRKMRAEFAKGYNPLDGLEALGAN